MIYYEFNRMGNGGKYKEMTEAEYELAMQDPNRYFLEGWDESHKKQLYIIECSREEYKRCKSEQDGIEKRLRDKSNHKATVLSIEGDMIDCDEGHSVFSDGNHSTLEENVLNTIAKDTMLASLKEEIGRLSAKDQFLIQHTYGDLWTQEQIAEELGCSQQYISKRLKLVLNRLTKRMRKNW